MKYKEKIHVWDLPATRIYVLLEGKIRENLINKAINKSNSIIKGKTRRKADKLGLILRKKSKKYKVKNCNYNSRIIFHWRKGEAFMPLWVLIELSNLVKEGTLNLRILEKRILSYKSRGSNAMVTGKCLFPLKLTPELISIYFHMVGDGYFSKKNSTSVYTQLDLSTRKIFLQKLKKAFGYSNLSIKPNSKYTMIFPTIFITLLSSILKPNSYMSKEARIPKFVKDLPQLYKFAGAIAYLLDEGHIGDSIYFSSTNKLFLKDLGVLLKNIGYETVFRVYNQKGVLTYFIYLKNKDLPKFYKDYKILIKRHKACNLSNKEDFLKLLVELNKKRGKKYTKEKAAKIKENAIKILENNSNKKTNEIRLLLYKKYGLALSYRAAHHYLSKLAKEKLIKHINLGLSKHSWSLINKIK
jgi:hypothetical protein